MSFDSFDDFFSSGTSDKSKMANLEVIVTQLFNFSEKMFTQLATIIDELDAKVTGFEAQLIKIQSSMNNMSRAPAPAASSASAPLGGSSIPPPPGASKGLPPPPGGSSIPPPPGGTSSGLPPLPGLAAPSAPAGGFRPASPAGPSGPPGSGGAPAKQNPMMVRAQLQNELAEAFKKIRANLKEDE